MRLVIQTEVGSVDAEIIKVEGYTTFYKPSLGTEKWSDIPTTSIKYISVKDTHGHPKGI